MPADAATGQPSAQAYTAPQEAKSSTTKWLVGGGIAAAALAGIGILAVASGSFGTPVEYNTMTVEMLVSGDSDLDWLGGDCYDGLTGFSDISSGAQVRVSDGTGELLGTGSLSVENDSDYISLCLYEAQVFDIPDDRDFYSVELGNRNRGELSYSKADMIEQDWTVSLSLGVD